MIVGTVHSRESLRAARRLPAGTVDLLELRVDHFAAEPAQLLAAAPRLLAPLIVTVRHPAEGGVNALNLESRRQLFERFIPVATFLDVEMRSVKLLANTVATARAGNVQLILSTHHFRTTPTLSRLWKIVHRAAEAGADICKIAARADTPADLHRLLGLFTVEPPLRLSVMAMGRFGKISRLLFAQAGSALNYGYLASPNASGQWPATLLRQRLAEIEAGTEENRERERAGFSSRPPSGAHA